MANMTSGVLCRDIQRRQFIVFYAGPSLQEDGMWRNPWSPSFALDQTEWDEQYQLYDEHGKKIPPPAPGKCFEVEMEL